jgi:hypothetical protein
MILGHCAANLAPADSARVIKLAGPTDERADYPILRTDPSVR